MKWVKRVLLMLALAFLVMTFVNASWLAKPPGGYVRLLAHRGTSQQFSHKGLGNEDCTATRIETPVHDYLENTLPGLQMADSLGAAMIEVDIELGVIRAAFPGVWAYSAEGIKACTKACLVQGWLAMTPDVCKGGTIAVPLNYQWAFAGWPNKLQARMAAVGGHVILTGPYGWGRAPMGLDLPEQIGQIPSTFTGTVWVDGIWTIGPALHPAANHRNARKDVETAAGLEARRTARD